MAQTTDVQRQIDSPKAVLKTLRSDLSGLSKKGGKMVGGGAQVARDALREEVDKRIDRLKKAASAAREEASRPPARSVMRSPRSPCRRCRPRSGSARWWGGLSAASSMRAAFARPPHSP